MKNKETWFYRDSCFSGLVEGNFLDSIVKSIYALHTRYSRLRKAAWGAKVVECFKHISDSLAKGDRRPLLSLLRNICECFPYSAGSVWRAKGMLLFHFRAERSRTMGRLREKRICCAHCWSHVSGYMFNFWCLSKGQSYKKIFLTERNVAHVCCQIFFWRALFSWCLLEPIL